jgi:hypothetical protein
MVETVTGLEIPGRIRGSATVEDLNVRLYSLGLQFYTFFGISIGIKRRMIDIGKKNNFLLFAKCLKMYNFFAFAFKS